MTTLREEFEALMPEPAAWTLDQELQQRETTCKAHMWFVNPKNSSWAPLYTADQVREAMKAVAERCAVLVEGIQDLPEQARALKKFQDASGKGVSEELARGNHWSTVSTFNAGLKRAAAAIRAQAGGDQT